MRIICDFHANKKPGHFISPSHLYANGFPRSQDAERVCRVLEAMGYIKVKQGLAGEVGIYLTSMGCAYFETQADAEDKSRKEKIHDWMIAVFTAIAGALLSEPLWALLRMVYQAITKRPGG